MDLKNLKNVLSGQPAFYLRQARRAVFVNLIDDWSQATNLPLELREKLNKECPLKIQSEIFESKDKKSAKALIGLSDGQKAEAVLMRHAGRNTVCVSSQIGCLLKCLFCATGKIGFKRNLEADEIVQQVLLFARHLKKEGDRVDNVVFMGMGEPFLNYDKVMAAIRILNDQKEGMAIGARHISISTAGVVEGINKLSQEPLQINLAISLHAPNDKLRLKIVPLTKKYGINQILKAASEYIKKTRRKVMLEYIMIKGLNDSDQHAEELAALIKKLNQSLFFINLISYNPTGVFEPSSAPRIKKFKGILQSSGVPATQRWRFGEDIKGACGQLAGK